MQRQVSQAGGLRSLSSLRGVKKVIVAAPVKGDALNFVLGRERPSLRPRQHRLLTAASCTTNCLAPVVKVIHEGIGIERGVITTVHDATNTQSLVDGPIKICGVRAPPACPSFPPPPVRPPRSA